MEQDGEILIMCADEHKLCGSCFQELIQPTLRTRNVRRDPSDIGMCYRCPTCRQRCKVTSFQLLALFHGSWRSAFDEFGGLSALDDFVGNRYRPAGDRTSPVRTRSASASADA